CRSSPRASAMRATCSFPGSRQASEKMSEMLTIAGSRVEADARSASYRRLYATILVIQAIIAAVAFVYPEWACRLLGIPLAASAVPWPRLAATFLLALVAFQVPGYL